MSSKKADSAYQKGQMLGPYQIVGVLDLERGRYQALHTHRNIQVIVEVLRSPLLRDQEMAFRAQTQTLMKLQHPHILRLRDAGIHNYYPYLVTDQLSYLGLRDVYPQGKSNTLEKALPHLKQVAFALQYMHEQHILHGAVCPENILLDTNNRILLWGFVLDVIIQNQEQRLSKGDYMYGNLAYMAPERIQGNPCSASDQYSLAVIVYKLLSGVLPFTGSSYIEVADQQMHRPPPPLRQQAPQVSSKVESIVMRALAKSPERRFADVRAFVDALEQERQVAPRVATARHASPAQYTTPTHTTGVVPFSLGNVQGSTPPVAPANNPLSGLPPVPPSPLGAPSAPATWPPSAMAAQHPAPSAVPNQPVTAAQEPPQSPPAPRRDSKNTLARRAFAVGLVVLAAAGGAGASYLILGKLKKSPAPSVGPDETPLATVVPDPRQGLAFHGHTASVNAVAWSPDGKWIASASDDATVQVFDPTTGKHLAIYHGHGEKVMAVTWSPDGKSLASAGQDGTVQLWNASSGKMIYTYTEHKQSQVNTVSWSPDGLLIASGSEDKSVRVWSAADGTLVFDFLKHTAGVLCVGWQPDGSSVASGSWDGTLRDWATVQHGDHFKAGEQIFNYGGHDKKEVYALAWSPQGDFVASGGADRNIFISRASDGVPNNTKSFAGHIGSVRALAWSPKDNPKDNPENDPKNKLMASGDTDGMVYVWRIDEERTLVFKYFEHKNERAMVNGVAWSPDGNSIASAGSDGTVHVWQPPK